MPNLGYTTAMISAHEIDGHDKIQSSVRAAGNSSKYFQEVMVENVSAVLAQLKFLPNFLGSFMV